MRIIHLLSKLYMIVRLRVIIVIKEDHVNVMVECIRLERECADICAYLEQTIGRGSRLFQSWLKFVPRFVEMNVKKKRLGTLSKMC